MACQPGSASAFDAQASWSHPPCPLAQVDLKGVVTTECIDNSTKKVEANKEAKALLEEKFKSGKNR